MRITYPDKRAYDSLGNLVNQSGTTKTPLGFQGKYYDAESGLNYFYHRYYNPAIGRFTTEDPIGVKGGGNFFCFVNNSPIDELDSFGLYAHEGQACYDFSVNEFFGIEKVVITDKTGVAKAKSNADIIKQIMKEAPEEINKTKHFIDECDPKECLKCEKTHIYENETKSETFPVTKKGKFGLFKYTVKFELTAKAKVTGYKGICVKEK